MSRPPSFHLQLPGSDASGGGGRPSGSGRGDYSSDPHPAQRNMRLPAIRSEMWVISPKHGAGRGPKQWIVVQDGTLSIYSSFSRQNKLLKEIPYRSMRGMFHFVHQPTNGDGAATGGLGGPQGALSGSRGGSAAAAPSKQYHYFALDVIRQAVVQQPQQPAASATVGTTGLQAPPSSSQRRHKRERLILATDSLEDFQHWHKFVGAWNARWSPLGGADGGAAAGGHGGGDDDDLEGDSSSQSSQQSTGTGASRSGGAAAAAQQEFFRAEVDRWAAQANEWKQHATGLFNRLRDTLAQSISGKLSAPPLAAAAPPAGPIAKARLSHMLYPSTLDLTDSWDSHENLLCGELRKRLSQLESDIATLSSKPLAAHPDTSTDASAPPDAWDGLEQHRQLEKQHGWMDEVFSFARSQHSDLLDHSKLLLDTCVSQYRQSHEQHASRLARVVAQYLETEGAAVDATRRLQHAMSPADAAALLPALPRSASVAERLRLTVARVIGSLTTPPALAGAAADVTAPSLTVTAAAAETASSRVRRRSNDDGRRGGAGSGGSGHLLLDASSVSTIYSSTSVAAHQPAVSGNRSASIASVATTANTAANTACATTATVLQMVCEEIVMSFSNLAIVPDVTRRAVCSAAADSLAVAMRCVFTELRSMLPQEPELVDTGDADDVAAADSQHRSVSSRVSDVTYASEVLRLKAHVRGCEQTIAVLQAQLSDHLQTPVAAGAGASGSSPTPHTTRSATIRYAKTHPSPAGGQPPVKATTSPTAASAPEGSVEVAVRDILADARLRGVDLSGDASLPASPSASAMPRRDHATLGPLSDDIAIRLLVRQLQAATANFTSVDESRVLHGLINAKRDRIDELEEIERRLREELNRVQSKSRQMESAETDLTAATAEIHRLRDYLSAKHELADGSLVTVDDLLSQVEHWRHRCDLLEQQMLQRTNVPPPVPAVAPSLPQPPAVPLIPIRTTISVGGSATRSMSPGTAAGRSVSVMDSQDAQAVAGQGGGEHSQLRKDEIQRFVQLLTIKNQSIDKLRRQVQSLQPVENEVRGVVTDFSRISNTPNLSGETDLAVQLRMLYRFLVGLLIRRQEDDEAAALASRTLEATVRSNIDRMRHHVGLVATAVTPTPSTARGSMTPIEEASAGDDAAAMSPHRRSPTGGGGWSEDAHAPPLALGEHLDGTVSGVLSYASLLEDVIMSTLTTYAPSAVVASVNFKRLSDDDGRTLRLALESLVRGANVKELIGVAEQYVVAARRRQFRCIGDSELIQLQRLSDVPGRLAYLLSLLVAAENNALTSAPLSELEHAAVDILVDLSARFGDDELNSTTIAPEAATDDAVTSSEDSDAVASSKATVSAAVPATPRPHTQLRRGYELLITSLSAGTNANIVLQCEADRLREQLAHTHGVREASARREKLIDMWRVRLTHLLSTYIFTAADSASTNNLRVDTHQDAEAAFSLLERELVKCRDLDHTVEGNAFLMQQLDREVRQYVLQREEDDITIARLRDQLDDAAADLAVARDQARAAAAAAEATVTSEHFLQFAVNSVAMVVDAEQFARRCAIQGSEIGFPCAAAAMQAFAEVHRKTELVAKLSFQRDSREKAFEATVRELSSLQAQISGLTTRRDSLRSMKPSFQLVTEAEWESSWDRLVTNYVADIESLRASAVAELTAKNLESKTLESKHTSLAKHQKDLVAQLNAEKALVLSTQRELDSMIDQLKSVTSARDAELTRAKGKFEELSEAWRATLAIQTAKLQALQRSTDAASLVCTMVPEALVAPSALEACSDERKTAAVHVGHRRSVAAVLCKLLDRGVARGTGPSDESGAAHLGVVREDAPEGVEKGLAVDEAASRSSPKDDGGDATTATAPTLATHYAAELQAFFEWTLRFVVPACATIPESETRSVIDMCKFLIENYLNLARVLHGLLPAAATTDSTSSSAAAGGATTTLDLVARARMVCGEWRSLLALCDANVNRWRRTVSSDGETDEVSQPRSRVVDRLRAHFANLEGYELLSHAIVVTASSALPSNPDAAAAEMKKRSNAARSPPFTIAPALHLLSALRRHQAAVDELLMLYSDCSVRFDVGLREPNHVSDEEWEPSGEMSSSARRDAVAMDSTVAVSVSVRKIMLAMQAHFSSLEHIHKSLQDARSAAAASLSPDRATKRGGRPSGTALISEDRCADEQTSPPVASPLSPPPAMLESDPTDAQPMAVRQPTSNEVILIDMAADAEVMHRVVSELRRSRNDVQRLLEQLKEAEAQAAAEQSYALALAKTIEAASEPESQTTEYDAAAAASPNRALDIAAQADDWSSQLLRVAAIVSDRDALRSKSKQLGIRLAGLLDTLRAQGQSTNRDRLATALQSITILTSTRLSRLFYAKWAEWRTRREAVRQKRQMIELVMQHSEVGLMRVGFARLRGWAVRCRQNALKRQHVELLFGRSNEGLRMVMFRRWRVFAATQAAHQKKIAAARAVALGFATKMSATGRLRTYFSIWQRAARILRASHSKRRAASIFFASSARGLQMTYWKRWGDFVRVQKLRKSRSKLANLAMAQTQRHLVSHMYRRLRMFVAYNKTKRHTRARLAFIASALERHLHERRRRGAFGAWKAGVQAAVKRRARLTVAHTALSRTSTAAAQRSAFSRWFQWVVRLRDMRSKKRILETFLQSTDIGMLRVAYTRLRGWAVRCRQNALKRQHVELLFGRSNEGLRMVMFRRWRVFAATQAAHQKKIAAARAVALGFATKMSATGRLRTYFSIWQRAARILRASHSKRRAASIFFASSARGLQMTYWKRWGDFVRVQKLRRSNEAARLAAVACSLQQCELLEVSTRLAALLGIMSDPHQPDSCEGFAFVPNDAARQMFHALFEITRVSGMLGCTPNAVCATLVSRDKKAKAKLRTVANCVKGINVVVGRGSGVPSPDRAATGPSSSFAATAGDGGGAFAASSSPSGSFVREASIGSFDGLDIAHVMSQLEDVATDVHDQHHAALNSLQERCGDLVRQLEQAQRDRNELGAMRTSLESRLSHSEDTCSQLSHALQGIHGTLLQVTNADISLSAPPGLPSVGSLIPETLSQAQLVKQLCVDQRATVARLKDSVSAATEVADANANHARGWVKVLGGGLNGVAAELSPSALAGEGRGGEEPPISTLSLCCVTSAIGASGAVVNEAVVTPCPTSTAAAVQAIVGGVASLSSAKSALAAREKQLSRERAEIKATLDTVREESNTQVSELQRRMLERETEVNSDRRKQVAAAISERDEAQAMAQRLSQRATRRLKALAACVSDIGLALGRDRPLGLDADVDAIPESDAAAVQASRGVTEEALQALEDLRRLRAREAQLARDVAGHANTSEELKRQLADTEAELTAERRRGRDTQLRVALLQQAVDSCRETAVLLGAPSAGGSSSTADSDPRDVAQVVGSAAASTLDELSRLRDMRKQVGKAVNHADATPLDMVSHVESIIDDRASAKAQLQKAAAKASETEEALHLSQRASQRLTRRLKLITACVADVGAALGRTPPANLDAETDTASSSTSDPDAAVSIQFSRAVTEDALQTAEELRRLRARDAQHAKDVALRGTATDDVKRQLADVEADLVNERRRARESQLRLALLQQAVDGCREAATLLGAPPVDNAAAREEADPRNVAQVVAAISLRVVDELARLRDMRKHVGRLVGHHDAAPAELVSDVDAVFGELASAKASLQKGMSAAVAARDEAQAMAQRLSQRATRRLKALAACVSDIGLALGRDRPLGLDADVDAIPESDAAAVQASRGVTEEALQALEDLRRLRAREAQLARDVAGHANTSEELKRQLADTEAELTAERRRGRDTQLRVALLQQAVDSCRETAVLLGAPSAGGSSSTADSDPRDVAQVVGSAAARTLDDLSRLRDIRKQMGAILGRTPDTATSELLAAAEAMASDLTTAQANLRRLSAESDAGRAAQASVETLKGALADERQQSEGLLGQVRRAFTRLQLLGRVISEVAEISTVVLPSLSDLVDCTTQGSASSPVTDATFTPLRAAVRDTLDALNLLKGQDQAQRRQLAVQAAEFASLADATKCASQQVETLRSKLADSERLAERQRHEADAALRTALDREQKGIENNWRYAKQLEDLETAVMKLGLHCGIDATATTAAPTSGVTTATPTDVSVPRSLHQSTPHSVLEKLNDRFEKLNRTLASAQSDAQECKSSFGSIKSDLESRIQALLDENRHATSERDRLSNVLNGIVMVVATAVERVPELLPYEGGAAPSSSYQRPSMVAGGAAPGAHDIPYVHRVMDALIAEALNARSLGVDQRVTAQRQHAQVTQLRQDLQLCQDGMYRADAQLSEAKTVIAQLQSALDRQVESGQAHARERELLSHTVSEVFAVAGTISQQITGVNAAALWPEPTVTGMLAAIRMAFVQIGDARSNGVVSLDDHQAQMIRHAAAIKDRDDRIRHLTGAADVMLSLMRILGVPEDLRLASNCVPVAQKCRFVIESIAQTVTLQHEKSAVSLPLTDLCDLVQSRVALMAARVTNALHYLNTIGAVFGKKPLTASDGTDALAIWIAPVEQRVTSNHQVVEATRRLLGKHHLLDVPQLPPSRSASTASGGGNLAPLSPSPARPEDVRFADGAALVRILEHVLNGQSHEHLTLISEWQSAKDRNARLQAELDDLRSQIQESRHALQRRITELRQFIHRKLEADKNSEDKLQLLGAALDTFTDRTSMDRDALALQVAEMRSLVRQKLRSDAATEREFQQLVQSNLSVGGPSSTSSSVTTA